MHVQWKQQTVSCDGSRHRPCLVAFLVMDRESDGAGARTALGSVEIRYLDTRITCTRDFHQGLFWKKVEENLDRLELGAEPRRCIENEIARKIPRPSPEWALWGVTCIPKFE